MIMQSHKIYKFKSDKRTLIVTLLYLAIASLSALLIYHLYAGGYFSAWFISVVCGVIALLTLSIPRRLILTEQTLSIVCILEIDEIPLSEIVSIRKIDNAQCRYITPLLGSCGFFGHFGYYLDWSTFERVKMHATEWNNMVEIVDIYEDRHYISCREAEDLIARIEQHILQPISEPQEA